MTQASRDARKENRKRKSSERRGQEEGTDVCSQLQQTSPGTHQKWGAWILHPGVPIREETKNEPKGTDVTPRRGGGLGIRSRMPQQGKRRRERERGREEGEYGLDGPQWADRTMTAENGWLLWPAVGYLWHSKSTSLNWRLA